MSAFISGGKAQRIQRPNESNPLGFCCDIVKSVFSLPLYLAIGVFQCFAMVPGVSRSGATIVSAMLFGADKRSAAEFSFYPAIPTMSVQL